MGIGIYLLALLTSIYYYIISKSLFARNCAVFSLCSLVYASLSLEAGFPSSALKNFVDVSFLASVGSIAFYFYTLNIRYVLGVVDSAIEWMGRYFLFVALIALVNIPSYLIIKIPLFIQFSSEIHRVSYLQTGMGGVGFTILGEMILAMEIGVTVSFLIYLLIRYHRLLKKEKLLSFGLITSALFVVHDNLLGFIGVIFVAPLMAIGNIPETIRFLRQIVGRNYEKRLEYSEKLLDSLRESQELRISSQYAHDVSRVLNKLTYIDDSSIKKKIKETLDEKYEFIKRSRHIRRVHLRKNILIAVELFEVELRLKKIKFNVDVAEDVEVNFVLSDLFIILSNLIQNTIDHSASKIVDLKVIEGAIETQVIYSEHLTGDQGEKGFKSKNNLGQGIENVKRAALSNGASILFKVDDEMFQVRIRIFHDANPLV